MRPPHGTASILAFPSHMPYHTYAYEVHLVDKHGVQHITMVHISTTLNTPEIAARRDLDLYRHLTEGMKEFGYTPVHISRLETAGTDLFPARQDPAAPSLAPAVPGTAAQGTPRHGNIYRHPAQDVRDIINGELAN